jgi:hypothetical protein
VIKPKFFCNVCCFELDSDAFDEYYEDERNICILCKEETGEDDYEGDVDDENDFEEDEEE